MGEVTIWKYTLAVQDEQTISLPSGAQVLSVQTQGGVVCLWAMVDPAMPKVERMVYVRGTGHPISMEIGPVDFVGTVQLFAGDLVWHVFVSK